MERDFEWFLQNSEAYNKLDADQVTLLGNGGLIDDAIFTSEPKPAAAEPSPAPAPAAEEQDPVVLAKDGKNTIPYSELEAARAKAEQFETLSREQASLIENLKAAKAADAETGGTAAQDDLLEEFKKDYPDLASKLAPAIQKMIDAGVSAKTSKLEEQFKAAVAPLQEAAEDTAIDGHFAAIVAQIPDFDQIVESGAIEAWIKEQPSYVQSAANYVLEKGTAPEIIELFQSYKKSLGKPANEGLTKEEIEAKAKQAVDKAKSTTPRSASDIPGGTPSAEDGEPTTVEGWSRKFANMTPEQIMASL